jgi:hypothetical protein
LAIDIGLDGAAVADFYIGDIGANFQNLHSEFVTRNARIAEERHLPQVSRKIRAANPDSMNANKYFIGTGFARIRNFDIAKRLRRF